MYNHAILRLVFLSGGIFALILCLCLPSCQEDPIDFNTQIRPILNKNCVSCHGGVKQSGGFGLVFRENALGETRSGKPGIIPGDPSHSEMMIRIKHDDPEKRMPQDGDALSEQDIALLEKWIDQGAVWEKHWAYIPPSLPELPETESDWPESEIDHFVLNKMVDQGLKPNPKADKYSLIRRLSLDLTGLPPSPEAVKNFVNDKSANAYEKLVDSLLASSAYGEHWASMWLDLARYADSRGYERDQPREIWMYRDWVIKALNADMPYDQFTIEQLAGDMLDQPSMDQLIATGFNRNSVNNDEGGTDNEEYRAASIIDRVNTTWETWQATTMSCVQCHSHPYDPFTHDEFYQSYAYFNQVVDRDISTEHPHLRLFAEAHEDSLEMLKAWITDQASPAEANAWERNIRTGEPKLGPEEFSSTHKVKHLNRADDDFMHVYDSGYVALSNIKMDNVSHILLSYRLRDKKSKSKLSIRLDSPNGKEIANTQLPSKGWYYPLMPVDLSPTEGLHDLYFMFYNSESDEVCLIDGMILQPRLPSPKGSKEMDYQSLAQRLYNAKPEKRALVMVEKEAPWHRTTRLFQRGNWLAPGDTIEPNVPDIFKSKDSLIQNRLDFARWLASEENPLTARVMINRVWSKLFGRGIVYTMEDFGTLGDSPTHPELLDWLAIQFSQAKEWHLKPMIKMMVMSAAYQQSSQVDEEILALDPSNKWLSRASRFRLSAEQIRDQALMVSGLLSRKMYGPGVMPPQPEGVWTVVYSNLKWVTSEGEDAYRRAIYTFLRRSSPYPSLITFDATSREVCLSRRIETNTPLQALVSLNDPVYTEASLALARDLAKLEGEAWLSEAYFRIIGKEIQPELEARLKSYMEETLAHYEAFPEEAEELTGAPEAKLAAMTLVINSLINTDEFLVRS